MLSPLDEVGLTKSEIRSLSRRASLPTWDEPASACLSSRIPYHSEVTGAKLRMIERAEDVLRVRGFRVCRVRHHDQGIEPGGAPNVLARVEVGGDELAASHRARDGRRRGPRAHRDRLSARHDRPAGLPDGQPE